MENVMDVSRDVTKFGNAANKAGCRTQDPVQAPQSTSREASVKGTGIFKPLGDKGVDKSGSSRGSEWARDSAELAQGHQKFSRHEQTGSYSALLLFAGSSLSCPLD